MSNKAERKIKRIILDMLGELGLEVESIILFGSRARGDFEEESDYDILIITKNEDFKQRFVEIWEKVYQALHLGFPTASFDLIIKSSRQFEEEKDVVNTIANEAYAEGKEL